jgi:hypothetical protein
VLIDRWLNLQIQEFYETIGFVNAVAFIAIPQKTTSS